MRNILTFINQCKKTVNLYIILCTEVLRYQSKNLSLSLSLISHSLILSTKRPFGQNKKNTSRHFHCMHMLLCCLCLLQLTLVLLLLLLLLLGLLGLFLCFLLCSFLCLLFCVGMIFFYFLTTFFSSAFSFRSSFFFLCALLLIINNFACWQSSRTLGRNFLNRQPLGQACHRIITVVTWFTTTS